MAVPSSSTVSADVRGNESCANAGAVRQLANNNIAVFEIFIKIPFLVPVRSRALYSTQAIPAYRAMQLHLSLKDKQT
jgi:hypothetical protein